MYVEAEETEDEERGERREDRGETREERGGERREERGEENLAVSRRTWGGTGSRSRRTERRGEGRGRHERGAREERREERGEGRGDRGERRGRRDTNSFLESGSVLVGHGVVLDRGRLVKTIFKTVAKHFY
jgi:hypothetical protein